MNSWSHLSLALLLCVCVPIAACDDGEPDTTGSTEDASTGDASTGDDGTSSETGEGTSDGSTGGEPECMSDGDCGGGDICSGGTCIPDTSFWAVGEGGTVLRVSPTSGAALHPLALATDLHDIACFERSRAWFVGDGGVVGTTDDGGESWTLIDAGTDVDLRDVAAIDPLRVAIAGEDGTLLVSDDGLAFTPVPGPAGALTGVDVSPFHVLAVDEDGVIWRHLFGEVAASPVGQASAPLRAIDIGDHGPFAAAVGDHGALLWSDDGGLSWSARDAGTTLDLYAVQVKMDGSALLAVGAEGVVVRVDGDEVSVTHASTHDLLAIHVSHAGLGSATGAAGTVLHTRDAGRRFDVISSGLDVTIAGVDALGELHW